MITTYVRKKAPHAPFCDYDFLLCRMISLSLGTLNYLIDRNRWSVHKNNS